MKRPVIVLGAGGHARVLLETLRQLQVPVIGVTDLHPDEVDRARIGVPVLGEDTQISKHKPLEIYLVNGVGSTGDASVRKALFEDLKKKGYTYMSVIHPSAVNAKDAQIAEGAQIMAGAVVQTGSRIGENAIVNTRASVDHDCWVGAHAHIAPGAVLCGDVEVGEGAHIGAGAVVVQGISVPQRTLVKALTLVKAGVEGARER